MFKINAITVFTFALLTGLSLFLLGCKVDKKALNQPNWTLIEAPLFEHQTFDPTQFEGQYILMNYWAVWCTPCLKEMPELAAFAKQHPDSVKLLAINFDQVDTATMIEQSKQFTVEIPMLLEDPSAFYHWQTEQVLPYTRIVDNQLNVVDTLIGPQTLDSLNLWLSQQ